MILQVLLDGATLSTGVTRLARIAAPVGAVAISGGFFCLAFMSGFSVLVYLGAVSMATAVLITGMGLLRRPRAARL